MCISNKNRQDILELLCVSVKNVQNYKIKIIIKLKHLNSLKKIIKEVSEEISLFMVIKYNYHPISIIDNAFLMLKTTTYSSVRLNSG